MEEKKTIVYAVDDEEAIRELYAVALKSAGFEAKTFASGEELLSALKTSLPNVILLDVMLDGMDGFEILKTLKNTPRTAGVPVIMVSAKGEEISKVKGLDSGADDYIAKPFGVLELAARINAAARRSSLSSKLYTVGGVVMDESLHSVTVGGTPVNLTLKEYGVLRELMKNAGRLVERETIIKSVWGEDYFGETRTLDMHVAAVRKAVGTAADIETVRGVGYIMR